MSAASVTNQPFPEACVNAEKWVRTRQVIWVDDLPYHSLSHWVRQKMIIVYQIKLVKSYLLVLCFESANQSALVATKCDESRDKPNLYSSSDATN